MPDLEAMGGSASCIDPHGSEKRRAASGAARTGVLARAAMHTHLAESAKRAAAPAVLCQRRGSEEDTPV